jgi:hypothetical protein
VPVCAAPPFAQERLRLQDDGCVAVQPKIPWHDGTTQLVFGPLEFLEKLAAITPRPEVNLIICHGVLAPHARWRRSVVGYGRTVSDSTNSGGAAAPAPGPDGAMVTPRPRYWSWAALMQRAFAIDVLTCPRCGSRMRLIAMIHDPQVIRRILAHLGLSHSGQSPGPAPPEPSAAAS